MTDAVDETRPSVVLSQDNVARLNRGIHDESDLAAAAAEAAFVADLSWRFSPDTPVVSHLRLISRAALVSPGAAGPHIQRLDDQLRQVRGSSA